MARGKYHVYAAQCPTRQALDRIADRWTALIVGLLAERTHRFGELRRSIEGISHKVLVQTLRSLERDGLVHRQPLATTPPNDGDVNVRQVPVSRRRLIRSQEREVSLGRIRCRIAGRRLIS